MIHPRQGALVCEGIDASEFALENVFRHAVELDDDDALDFGLELRWEENGEE
jgi:hypothetical protein